MTDKVLLIDDDQRVLDSIARSLRHEPYEILTAVDPQVAVSIANEQEVSVIISDHDMPYMTGTELLSIFKNEIPGAVRIILTGKGDFQTALKAINSTDVYKFLTKPCSSSEIGRVIRNALNHRKLLLFTKRLLDLSQEQDLLIQKLLRKEEVSEDQISNLYKDSEMKAPDLYLLLEQVDKFFTDKA